MKYRLDFVTNSSSSSFICDVCGQQESGWDMCLSEAEMTECEEGHTFCLCHMAKSVEDNLKEVMISRLNDRIDNYKSRTDQWYVDRIKEYQETLEKLTNDSLDEGELDELRDDLDIDSEVPIEFCPICNFDIIADSDLTMYLEKAYKISRAEVFTKVKEANKRRKRLYDSEYVDYVCDKQGFTKQKLVTELKAKFKNYEEFINFAG
ncbi:MAG: hypothetical protein Q8910_00510 [Bacteroidota bacterium]|nr:hypothetical protein [Bacteroidota bacterium]